MSCTPINVTVEESQEVFVTVGNDTEINVTVDGYAATVGFQWRTELELQFKAAYHTKFSEFTFAAGALTEINIWDTLAKGVKLFTKTIEYVSGNIDTITITDELNGKILTTTFTYDVEGNIETKQEAIT